MSASMPRQIASALRSGDAVRVSNDEQRAFVIARDGLCSLPPGTQVDIERHDDGTVTLAVNPQKGSL